MNIAFFDTHRFEQNAFQTANQEHGNTIHFFEYRLTEQTAGLAKGFEAVCAFVNDRLNRAVLETLKAGGTRLIALRSAGFNNIDLQAAKALGLKVVRVPEYSPYAVAEHTVALILSLNRKTHRAYNRVREGNFSLEGLVGFDLHSKTCGIIGTGRIGGVAARILTGFGCKVLAYDPKPNAALAASTGFEYVSLERLLKESQIISLHCPLTPQTTHLIDGKAIGLTQPGVMIINTGRGKLIDTKALIAGLKTGHIGAAGLDVYEEEEGVFFVDHSSEVIQDDVLARLMTFPNVLITSHQAFLTKEALSNIASTTLENVAEFAAGKPLKNEVSA